MRVVVVIKTNQGGYWILPQIREARRRGHEVIVVLPGGPGRLRKVLDAEHVPVVESAFGFRFRPGPTTVAGLLRLRRQLRGLEPDVLFYQLYASALAVRLATLRLGVPRVHMVPGPLFLESPVIHALERLLARLDTVTVCGTEFTSRLYRALGRPEAATPAIAYGVDTAYFQPPDEETRRRRRAELGLEEDTFVAVMVAFVYAPKRAVHRARGIKGHDVLLDAWMAFNRPRSHLFLVGSGFGEGGDEHRRELIERYGLESPDRQVTWVGRQDDVRPFYVAADVSVSPSLSEGHGASDEAAAMGVPGIVSDAGGLPETVTPDSGWVVPRGDVPALVAALEEAWREHQVGTLAKRGARARALVETSFDGIRNAAAVVDLLETVTRPPVSGPETS